MILDTDSISQQLPDVDGRCVTLFADQSNSGAIIVSRSGRHFYLYPGYELTVGLFDQPHLAVRSDGPAKLHYRVT